MKEFKTKIDDLEVDIIVKRPTYENIQAADGVYSKKMASLIRSDKRDRLLLRSELDDFLEANNIWTIKDIEKCQELQAEVDSNLNTLRKGATKLSEGREIAIKTIELRKQLLLLMSKRQQFEDLTMESMAEEEKADYLVYLCTFNKNTESNYWSSFDEMKSDKFSEVFRKAKNAMFELTTGISSDVESTLPETLWLKKYRFVNDDLRYTDRVTGKVVDRNYKEVKLEPVEDVAEATNNLYGEILEEKPFIDDYAQIN